MTTPDSTVPPIIDTQLTQQAVAAQFSTRPGLRSVVSQLLLEQLNSEFKGTVFDLCTTYVVLTVGPEGTPLETPRYRLLLDVLLNHIARQEPLNFGYYAADECYLAISATVPPPSGHFTSAQSMRKVEPLLFNVVHVWQVGLQQALITYWNEPADAGPARLHWLVKLIQDRLLASASTTSSLTQEQRTMLCQMLDYPDRIDRFNLSGLDRTSQVYTVAASLVADGQKHEFLTPDILIVHPGTLRNTVLYCKLNGLVQVFPSLDHFTEVWGKALADRYEVETVNSVLYEPEGNFLEAQVMSLLERHLDVIMAPMPVLSAAELERHLFNATDTATVFKADAQAEPINLANIYTGLPEWLRNASVVDRFAYRSHLTALASTLKNAHGKRFDDDIFDLRSFAVYALRQQMYQDQPLAPRCEPNDIELTFYDPVGPGGEGTIGTLNPFTMTLTELALENLTAVRGSRMLITHAKGQTIQGWMTPRYIKSLVQAVDIGLNYPRRIRRYLLDTPQEAQRRERLFINELRVQLPLQALECKIRQEGNMTEQGYQSVSALMCLDPAARKVGQQTIRIRPLAFLTAPTAQPDVVRSMFVIGPQDVNGGPHVLYRPMHQNPLLEFSSWAALLAAIAQSGPLEQSVLEWLPSGARRTYEAGGFNRLNLASSSVHEDFTLPIPAGAALLSTFALNNNFEHTLYTEMALTLSELADRQTVSNREQRWASLMNGGWLLFSAVVPNIPLAWPLRVINAVLTTFMAVQNDIEALRSPDQKSKAAAIIDLLFNSALALLHVSTTTHPARVLEQEPDTVLLPKALQQRQVEAPRRPLKMAEIKAGPIYLPAVAVGNRKTSLDFSWFNHPRIKLSFSQLEWLDRNRGQVPGNNDKPMPHGPHKGLYVLNNKWHALVNERSYQVELESESVVVVSPRDTAERGPRVMGDETGVWRFDTRLKLRGGGPKTQLETRKYNRIKRLTDLRAKLDFYNANKDSWQSELNEAFAANERVNDKESEATLEQRNTAMERYVAVIERRKPDFETALEALVQKNELLVENHDHAMLAWFYKFMIHLSCRLYDARLHFTGFLQAQHPNIFTVDINDVPVAEYNSPSYKASCRKIIEHLDKSAEHFKALEAYFKQLRAVPKQGFREALDAQKDYVVYSYRGGTKYRSQVYSRAFELLPLRDLITPEAGSNDWNTLRAIIDTLFYTSLSQSELEDESLFSDTQRAEILTDMVERYGSAKVALDVFSDEALPRINLEYFEHLKGVVDELQRRTETMLSEQAAAQSEWLPVQPKPARTSHDHRKIVRTPKKGILIGRVRPGRTGEEPEIVDVGGSTFGDVGAAASSNGAGLVAASFKETAPDQWVEIESAAPVLSRTFSVIKPQANALLNEVTGKINRVKGYAKGSKYPLELQEILEREAQKLDKLSLEIKTVTPEQAPVDKPRPGTPQAVIKRLEAAAARLRSQGIDLLFSVPPTTATVEFLLEQQQVHIVKINERIAMTGERQDFVQEYEVQNSANRVMWYAHLHYSDAQSPADKPTTAHFKLLGQRMESKKSLETKAKPGLKVPEVYYGKISDKMVKERFLNLNI